MDGWSVDGWSVDGWSVDEWSVDEWSVDGWSVDGWSVTGVVMELRHMKKSYRNRNVKHHVPAFFYSMVYPIDYVF